MRGDGLLHLDRRDVLAAGDDDVLAAVAQLDVAVRMQDGEVAGVEPAASERGRGRLGVVVVARSSRCCRASRPRRSSRRRAGRPHAVVHDANQVGEDAGLALPRAQRARSLGRQRRPLSCSGHTVIGPVRLRQAVDVDDPEFSSSIRAKSVGDGGAAATTTVIGGSTRCASGWLMIISCTVGAPLKFVIASASTSSQISSASTLRMVRRAGRRRRSPPRGSTSRCSGTSAAARGRRSRRRAA